MHSSSNDIKNYENLVDLLHYQADTITQKVAYTFSDAKQNQAMLTYGGLHTEAMKIAALLQTIVKPGDRVLIMYKPGLEFIAAFFGCIYAGAIAVPAHPPANNAMIERLKHMIINCQPQALLTTDDIKHKLSQIKWLKLADKLGLHKFTNRLCRNQNKILDLELNLQILTTDNLMNSNWSPVPIKSHDIAFLQYTSGSTNAPKGVAVTHENLLVNLELISRAFQASKDTISVSWLPPYHDMGLIGGILGTLYNGVPHHLMSAYDFLINPLSWLKLISQFRGTISGGPNFAYELCVNKIPDKELHTLDLSSWIVAFNGAEPISKISLEKFYNKFRACHFKREAFFTCYGLAESTVLVSAISHQNKDIDHTPSEIRTKEKLPYTNNFIISSGHPYTDIKIVDPDTFKELPENMIGEIWVAGKSVAKGYWGNNALTEQIFKAKIINSQDNKEYLRTGDLGFMSKGQLYVTGRIKDLIIVHGVNYYPNDIEHMLNYCHPAIISGRIVAFAEMVEGKDELVIACEIKEKQEDYKDIIDTIRTVIAKEFSIHTYKIYLLSKKMIPKTLSGKLQRSLCKKLLTNNELSTFYIWSADPKIFTDQEAKVESKQEININHSDLEKFIITEIKKLLNLTDDNILELDTKLTDLITSSLLVTQLHSSIINKYGNHITLDAETFFKDTTLKDFILIIQSQLENSDKNIHSSNVNNTVENVATFAEFKEIKNFQTRYQTLTALGADKLWLQECDYSENGKIYIQDKSYINFASYNYLGLAEHPAVKQAVKAAVDKYGTSASASRIASGDRTVSRELEQAIADLIGVDSAIVFTAGHATVISTLTHLYAKGDLIIYDQLAHNSTILGTLYSGAEFLHFPHNDWQALETILSQQRSHYRRVLIIFEGIYSMDGDIPPVDKYVALKKRFHCQLMVDEAHSIGVLGATGAGIREHFNLQPNDIDIWMGTLSKAFASCGGYIAGCHELIRFLKYTAPGFVFSAGISPQNAAAALAAIKIMQQEPARLKTLQENAHLFLMLAKQAGFNTGASETTPIVPIILGDSIKSIQLSKAIFDNGINAPPIIAPAVPENSARVRFFIQEQHTGDMIIQTIEILKAQWMQLKNV